MKERKLQRSAVIAWLLGSMKKCMNTWQGWLRALRSSRLLAGNALAHWGQRDFSRAWLSWCSSYLELLHLERTTDRAIKSCKAADVKRAWNAILVHTEGNEGIASNKACLQAMKRWRNLQISRALVQWHWSYNESSFYRRDMYNFANEYNTLKSLYINFGNWQVCAKMRAARLSAKAKLAELEERLAGGLYDGKSTYNSPSEKMAKLLSVWEEMEALQGRLSDQLAGLKSDVETKMRPKRPVRPMIRLFGLTPDQLHLAEVFGLVHLAEEVAATSAPTSPQSPPRRSPQSEQLGRTTLLSPGDQHPLPTGVMMSSGEILEISPNRGSSSRSNSPANGTRE